MPFITVGKGNSGNIDIYYEDRILPIDSTGNRLAKFIKGSQYVVVPSVPHALAWTHADKIKPVLLDFLGQGN
jgi:pimeloyl-ACP methyl ester carboxylesterase